MITQKGKTRKYKMKHKDDILFFMSFKQQQQKKTLAKIEIFYF